MNYRRFTLTPLRSVLTFLVLLAYPTVFLAPVILPPIYDVMPTPGWNAGSDLLGSVRIAAAAQWGSFPLAQNFTAYPDGEALLGFAAASQTIQLSMLWILGKFINGFFVTNFLLLVGWVATGWCVYLIARVIGVSRFLATLAGVTAQSLPFLQISSSSYFSFMWSGLALVPLTLVVKWLVRKESRWIVLASIFCLMLAFFDPYLFAFGLLLYLAGLLYNWRDIVLYVSPNPVFRSALVLLPTIPVAVLHMFGVNRTLGGTRVSEVLPRFGFDSQGALLTDLLVPTSGHGWVGDYLSPIFDIVVAARGYGYYGGVVIFLLAILGTLFAWKRHDRPAKTIALSTIILLLFAMRGAFRFPLLEVENVLAYLRYLFPGLIHFNRASYVAQLLLVALAAWGVSALVHRLSKRVAMSVMVLLGVLIPLDMQPLAYQGTPNSSGGWEELRKSINEGTEQLSVVFMPNQFDERNWLQQVYLNVPMYNSLTDDQRYLALQNQPDSQSLACHLSRFGLTDVVLRGDSGEGLDSIQSKVKPPYFTLVNAVPVNGYDSTSVVLRHYRIAC